MNKLAQSGTDAQGQNYSSNSSLLGTKRGSGNHEVDSPGRSYESSRTSRGDMETRVGRRSQTRGHPGPRERHGGVRVRGRLGCCPEGGVAKTEVSDEEVPMGPSRQGPVSTRFEVSLAFLLANLFISLKPLFKCLLNFSRSSPSCSTLSFFPCTSYLRTFTASLPPPRAPPA